MDSFQPAKETLLGAPHGCASGAWLEVGGRMTETQFVVLAALIWIAPHCPTVVGLLGGSLILLAASLKGLGWA